MPWALAFLFLVGPNPAVLNIPSTPVAEAAPDPQVVWMNALAQRESMGSTTIKVLDTNGYYSYGKYQWQMKSWLTHADLGATKDNIYDEAMQDKITRIVLDEGGWRNWYNSTLYLEKTLGPYPHD